MKGQRAPRNRPSESQPQVAANAIKIPDVTSGTVIISQISAFQAGRFSQLLICGTVKVTPGTGYGFLLKLFSQ
jgi:hypothetical protein